MAGRHRTSRLTVGIPDKLKLPSLNMVDHDELLRLLEDLQSGRVKQTMVEQIERVRESSRALKRVYQPILQSQPNHPYKDCIRYLEQEEQLLDMLQQALNYQYYFLQLYVELKLERAKNSSERHRRARAIKRQSKKGKTNGK